MHFFQRIHLLRLLNTYSSLRNIKKYLERKSHLVATRKVLKRIKRGNIPQREISFSEIPNLVEAAKTFRKKHGYFPISFGLFPGLSNDLLLEKKLYTISPIIPGKKYSFTDQQKYFQTYSSSSWGITHKKGGWDCMRHLEIIGSGAIPLMHDAKRIPDGAMFLYPKEMMSKLYGEFLTEPFIPTENLRNYFKSWFNEYLTASAVVRYMLNVVNSEFRNQDSRILFVDSQLAERVDYMSAVLLSGLLVNYPKSVDIYESAPAYMFDDYEGATGKMYGRGFGYSKCCSAESRKIIEPTEVDFSIYAFIVVPNALGNEEFLLANQGLIRNDQLILVDGGDEQIGKKDLSKLMEYKGALFLREGSKK